MTVTTGANTSTEPAVRVDPAGIYRALCQLEQPCYFVRTERGIGVTTATPTNHHAVVAALGPLPPQRLGSAQFAAQHGVGYAYMAGAMAGGIASEDLVIALANNGLLGSFGAAGLLPERIERALRRFQDEIPGKPFAANLIHSPSEDALERGAVELYLKHRVRCVEASAFMDLTPNVVRYRVAGLSRGRNGELVIGNRLIAKVSRPEVAEKFLQPPPEPIVADLVARGLVSAEQAAYARAVPMADDITVEADSGGHTDRRPLTALFDTIVRLRDRVVRDMVQRERRYANPPRIGAAGGIGTPQAAAAAFALGADYVVTGSVNQACLESGTSPAARKLLAAAGITDCEMAPAADMFELGVELQVLRKGTLFPMRARRLYELYRAHDGIDALPAAERARLEQQVFRRPIAEIWDDVVEYFTRRDPDQLVRAAEDPRRKMALIFRWYLGMASRWAVVGEPDRAADYQIWCGPAMGAFNEWVRGTYLAAPENRRVADVAVHLLRGAAFASRVHQLALSGVRLPASCTDYRAAPLNASKGGAR